MKKTLLIAIILIILLLAGTVSAAILPLVEGREGSIPPTPAIKIIKADSNTNVTAKNSTAKIKFEGKEGITVLADYVNNIIRFFLGDAGALGIEVTIPTTWESLTNVTDIGCSLNQIRIANATGWWVCATQAGGGGEANTASNFGTWGTGVFKDKVGVDLRFLKLLSTSSGLVISSNSSNVLFSFVGGGGNASVLAHLGDVAPLTSNYGDILQYNGTLYIDKKFMASTTACPAGQALISFTNSTGILACTTFGNATSLDNLGDVIITSPAYHSILAYNGNQWIDKLFRINNQTTGDGVTWINGIDNVTGQIRTKTFSINSITCGGTDKLSGLDNVTGQGTCTTDVSGGGGGNDNKTNIAEDGVNVSTKGRIINFNNTNDFNLLNDIPHDWINASIKRNSPSGMAGLDSNSRIAKAQAPSTTAYEDEVNNFTVNDQKFSNCFYMRNPAYSFTTKLCGGAVTANQTLNLPAITGTDTLGALNLAQKWTANQTLQNPQINGLDINYTSFAADHTAAYTEDHIVMDISGASRSFTLPTAVGHTGKVFIIQTAGLSAGNVLMIKTTSSQTIDGYFSATGTINMTHVDEILSVISNGANWDTTLGIDPAEPIDYFIRGSTTRWYGNNIVSQVPLSVVSVPITLRASPWIVPHTIQIDKIQAEIATAANPTSTTCRIGIYRDNGNVSPQALVSNSDVGTFTTTAGVKTLTFGSPITLTKGLYWLAYTCGDAATTEPTWRGMNADNVAPVLGHINTMGSSSTGTGYTVAFTFAALPASFPAGATITSNTNHALILVEISKG